MLSVVRGQQSTLLHLVCGCCWRHHLPRHPRPLTPFKSSTCKSVAKFSDSTAVHLSPLSTLLATTSPQPRPTWPPTRTTAAAAPRSPCSVSVQMLSSNWVTLPAQKGVSCSPVSVKHVEGPPVTLRTHVLSVGSPALSRPWLQVDSLPPSSTLVPFLCDAFACAGLPPQVSLTLPTHFSSPPLLQTHPPHPGQSNMSLL